MRLGLPSRHVQSLPAAILASMALLGPAAVGQEVTPAVREAYFRAVGEHFDVPFQEVTLISEGELHPDEVPVVVFLAERAGVSPDVLVALRQEGRPWREVARRFGLDAQAFHLNLPDEAELGSLSRAYGEFRDRPVADWGGIRLEDEDIITLVNLRVLMERTGAAPARILTVKGEAGTFLASLPRLVPR